MTMPLADYTEQADVTNWPGRVLAVLITLALIGLALWGMRRGWLNRQRRQADIVAPVQEAGAMSFVLDEPGLFLGTSRAGDWLDRIAVHDLGVRSQARCHVGSDGVWLERQGAADVVIPVRDIVEVRVDRGVAATVRSKDSVLVLTWDLGDVRVDTGFRAATADAQQRLLDAMTQAGLPIRTESSA